MKALDKFIVIEGKVNQIFSTLMGSALTEGEKLSTYLENKAFLDRIKATLIEVSKDEDKAIGEKARSLVQKIDKCLTDFAQVHLNIGASDGNNPGKEALNRIQKELAPTQEYSTAALNLSSVTPSDISLNTYFLVLDDKVCHTMKCTESDLIGYLVANYHGTNIPIQVIKGDYVKLKTRTVFELG